MIKRLRNINNQMKYLIVLFMAFSCCIINGQTNDINIIGRWIGLADDDSGIEFLSNDSAKIMISSNPIKEFPVKYQIDYSKTPLDIDLTGNIDGKKITILGLIQFIDSSTMRFEITSLNSDGIEHSEDFQTKSKIFKTIKP